MIRRIGPNQFCDNIRIDEWKFIMSEFSECVVDGSYNKMAYQVWKKLDRTTANDIIINFDIDTGTVSVDIPGEAKHYFYDGDKSFGEFLFTFYLSYIEDDMEWEDMYRDNYGNWYNEDKLDEASALTASASTLATGVTTYTTLDSCDGLIATKATDGCYNFSNTLTNKIDEVSVSIEDRPTFNDVKNMIDESIMKKEKENTMKGFTFDFGPCTGDNVRMSMYGLAVKNAAGEWVSYNTNSHEIVNVDVFNMADGGKYMYKMPVAINDVKKGDIVIHNRVPMFVTAVNDNGTFEVTDVRAGEAKTVIPTRNMFGFNFMTKVVNLFGAFTDTPTADQPFGNMLPFLMLGDENKDIDPMMMYMLMGQNGGTTFNPMMWYFLMKDKNENKDMDPMAWMCLSMAMGTTPGFMTQNHTCTCNCDKTTDEKPTV